MNQIMISLCMTLVFSVTGCDKPNTAVNKQDISKSQKTISHAYSGKPSAPVQLDYQFNSQPQIGVPLTITLQITPGVNANAVRVDYQAADAQLTIMDNATTFEIYNLTAHQSVTRSIHVIPQAAGTHYLQLTVTIDSVTARSGARSFSIPIKAANIENQSDLPSAAKTQLAPSGENLIIQKGVETRTVNP
jgi:hypothetical protein